MIIRNSDGFRSQFYDVIRKEHVLLITADDVDALCSSSILTSLFACDDVSFSIATVSGWDALERTLREHYEQNPAIVMINCGGNKALEELNMPPESKVFIIDSRRPLNHENLYSRDQVVVLMDSQEESSLKIPSEDAVIPPDSDEESSEDEEGADGDGRSNRMDRIQRRVLKNEVKRNWERKRRDLLWNYYESTWFSMATSVRMLELAAALNRASSEHMWLAAVGLNSQWTDSLISTEAYTTVCIERMRPFINKFSPKNAPKADDVLRVAFEKDVPLAMYTRWSLYRAMQVNEYFACRTRNWTQRGESEMKHMLAGLGLTLNESRQKFEALPTERRKEVFGILEKEMTSSFASFFAQLGFCNRISAADLARALVVKLETPSSKPLSERFAAAKDVVTPFFDHSGDFLSISKACETYMVGLQAIWNYVAAAVNQSEILPTGPFYLFSSSRQLETDLLSSRHFLYLFSRFLLRAFAVSGRNRGRKPLIVALPLSGEKAGWHLVTGVMPLDAVYDDNLLKCYIGRAFREVSKKHGMDEAIIADRFDTNIITLRSADRSRFFDVLQAVMEVT